MENKLNAELDVTRFVNIDNEPFDIYINKNLARHLEAGEENTIVLYVAQVGAKHLVDRVLQKQGIKDTLRDTPLRKDLFARILPDLATKLEIKPLTEEERKEQISKQIKEQDSRFSEELKKRDEDIEALRKELEALKAPKKVVKK